MADYLLSFEQSDIPDEIIIHGDEKGLIELQRIIQSLLKTTKEGHFDHTHLMTPAWGGNELSEENKGGRVINHVKLYCWKGNEYQK